MSVSRATEALGSSKNKQFIPKGLLVPVYSHQVGSLLLSVAKAVGLDTADS